MPPKREIVLGLDLASTYSCACIAYKAPGGDGLVLENVDFNYGVGATDYRSISVVAFDSQCSDFYVGQEALDMIKEYPGRFQEVRIPKRDIGRLVSDDDYTARLASDSRPLKPERYPDRTDQLGEYGYRLTRGDGVEQFLAPYHVAAALVEHLVDKALVVHGADSIITGLCYAVPARFSDTQRVATAVAIKAGLKRANLEGVKIKQITEPEAACMVLAEELFGMLSGRVVAESNKSSSPFLAMVVDLGGSTSDISLGILHPDQARFVNLANIGNDVLGGSDITTDLAKSKLVDEAADVAPLFTTVERLKMRVVKSGTEQSAKVSLGGGGKMVDVKLSPEEVEAATRRVFSGLPDMVRDAISSAGVTLANMVSERPEYKDLVGSAPMVYMTGGCSEIPAVREMVLEAAPDGSRLVEAKGDSVYTAVSMGCAAKAAAACGMLDLHIEQVTTRGLHVTMNNTAGDRFFVQVLAPGVPVDKARGMVTAREWGKVQNAKGWFSMSVYQPKTQDLSDPIFTARDEDFAFDHPFDKSMVVDLPNVHYHDHKHKFQKLGTWRIPRPGSLLPSPSVYDDPPRHPSVMLMFNIDENGAVGMTGKIIQTAMYTRDEMFSGRLETSDTVQRLVVDQVVCELSDPTVRRHSYEKLGEMAGAMDAEAKAKEEAALREEDEAIGCSDDDDGDDDEPSDGDDEPEAKKARVDEARVDQARVDQARVDEA